MRGPAGFRVAKSTGKSSYVKRVPIGAGRLYVYPVNGSRRVGRDGRRCNSLLRNILWRAGAQSFRPPGLFALFPARQIVAPTPPRPTYRRPRKPLANGRSAGSFPRQNGSFLDPGELQSHKQRGQVHVFGRRFSRKARRVGRKMDQPPDFAVLLFLDRAGVGDAASLLYNVGLPPKIKPTIQPAYP